MADGSNFSPSPHPILAQTLGEVLMPGLSLAATCVSPQCGRTASFDPAPWIGQGLSASPLAALQSRVRCVCGSRAALLELCAAPAAPARSSDPFIFR